MDDETFVRKWLGAAEREESLQDFSTSIGRDYRAVYRQYQRLSQKHQLPALFGQRVRMSKNDQRLSRLIAAWRAKREAQLKQV
jgi:hypothetical protein